MQRRVEMLKDMLQTLALIWQVIVFLLQELKQKKSSDYNLQLSFFKRLLDVTPKAYKPDKQALQNTDM